MNDMIAKQRKQKVMDRASDFATLLYSGVMSDKDEQELERWLAESPEHLVEYQAVLETWDKFGSLMLDDELVAFTKGEGEVSRRRWPVLAIAATVTLAFAVTLMMQFGGLFGSSEALTRYVTAKGERQRVMLEDGTQMVMNTDTRLLVDFSGDRRRVILDKGEVFFDIAKDAARPFCVDTGVRSITVLGTSFNVLKRGSSLGVGVLEGLVAVHHTENDLDSVGGGARGFVSREGDYLVEAGSLLNYADVMIDSAELLIGDLADVGRFASWRTGTISFDDKSLSEVVEELNRYSRLPIIIMDESLAGISISAHVILDDIDGALIGLQTSQPLTVEKMTDRIALYRKGD